MGKKGKGKKEANQQEQKQQEEVVQKKQQQASQQTKQNKGEQQPQLEVLKPKKVQYCPICTFPFQLCKYGKKASECKKFLMQVAPTKVSKYHPESNTQNQQQEQEKKEKVEQKKQPKKQKSVKQKYLLIDVKQRDKKKFTSEVSGLKIFDVDSKQLAKKLCKKFACSCSATDEDKVLVQGDFFDDIKEILINDYKVKKKYILDKDEYKEKVGEEKQKKKEEKKKDKNVIQEQPEDKQQDKTEPPQPEAPKFKNKMQQALADLDDEQDN